MEDQNEMEDYSAEIDTHDVAVAAYNRVDALLELLIRKGVITEDEYDSMEEELQDSVEEDFAEDEEDSESGETPSMGGSDSGSPEMPHTMG